MLPPAKPANVANVAAAPKPANDEPNVGPASATEATAVAAAAV